MGAGNGGVVDAAASATEAAQPVVVLKMDLHCAGCAHKVKKAIKRLPGVESVAADVAAKRVVVAGTADAVTIKARIETKTSKIVEVVVSAGSGGPKKAAVESSGDKKADKDGGAGEKKGDNDASTREETKPKVETTVLLKIRLHCDGCADRIRRRISKFKGVKDVALDGNAKDEVKVSGTMDVPALLAYLREKLNRPVEAVAACKRDSGGEVKDGDKNKTAAAAGGGDDNKDKSIDKADASTAAAAAAFMAPAPAEASTYHVPPPYGYVAYPPGPATSSYYHHPYNYGNADGGMRYSSSSASAYDHQQQYQYSHPEVSGQHQAYAPYPYHMAPPPQLFSDENPNACSVM